MSVVLGSKNEGFTLFEVLVTLAIAALLAGIAFPAMDKAMRRQGFLDAATRFEVALYAARAQALRGGVTVRFAISADRSEFGYRGAVDRLPKDMLASAPGGAIAFFADGTASDGTLSVVSAGLSRGWRIGPATGAIERVR